MLTPLAMILCGALAYWLGLRTGRAQGRRPEAAQQRRLKRRARRRLRVRPPEPCQEAEPEGGRMSDG